MRDHAPTTDRDLKTEIRNALDKWIADNTEQAGWDGFDLVNARALETLLRKVVSFSSNWDEANTDAILSMVLHPLP